MKSTAIVSKEGPLQFKGIRRTYLYMRRADRTTVVLISALLFFMVVIAGILGYLLVQDLAQSGKIFPGITIDNHAVGGLTRAAATDLVNRKITAPLEQPLVLYHDDDEIELDPKNIDLAVDTDKMVLAAYWSGRNQNIVTRMFRRFFNKPLHLNIPVIVKYDSAKLNEFVKGVAAELDYPPRSASIDMSKGAPIIKHSKYGLTIQQAETVKSVSSILSKHNRKIPLVTVNTKPDVTDDDIDKIVVIKQSEYKLYLYSGEQLADTFAVAVGTPQYPTPNGKFYIVNKEKNPTWYPPKSDWAKDKKPIPPGPGNPLGPYWMELGSGIGIHSTPDEASLGYSASHGCIRMSEWGALQLFNAVHKGTPVYILP